MWFGHGTSPKKEAASATSNSNDIFNILSVDQRADYAAASVIGHVPRQDRQRWESCFDQSGRERLKTAIAAWYGASALDRDAFRQRLLDPFTGDDVVDRLRSAARDIVEAQTPEDLKAAGTNLAYAAQKIGVDRWPRYIADADRCAIAAASKGEIPNVVKASAAGTDSAATGVVLLLGGLYFFLKSQERQAKPGTLNPPSSAPMVPTQPTIVEAAVPVPPPKEGETPTDILKPDGRLVGQAGSSSDIRELPGGEVAAEELFDRLTKGGTDVTPARYPGRRVRLPNGDTIGYRPKSTSGPPTIDVDVAGVGIDKLKFPGK